MTLLQIVAQHQPRLPLRLQIKAIMEEVFVAVDVSGLRTVVALEVVEK